MSVTAMDLVAQAKAQINEIPMSQFAESLSGEPVVIDVREPEEFSKGHIPGAINIPRGLLEFQIAAHPAIKDKAQQLTQGPFYLYCQSGGRSALAAQSLLTMGYEQVVSVAGGYAEWQKQNA